MTVALFFRTSKCGMEVSRFLIGKVVISRGYERQYLAVQREIRVLVYSTAMISTALDHGITRPPPRRVSVGQTLTSW